MSARKSLTLDAALHQRLKMFVAKSKTKINDETDAAIQQYISENRAALKSGARMPQRKNSKP